ALAGIEPLHSSLFFTHCFHSFPSAGDRLSTTLSYLMPQVRAPQQSRGRLQALSGKAAKQSTEQKNGRKCDLATALLPKGDTRATNAKTEYHGLGNLPSEFFVPLSPSVSGGATK